MTIAHLFLGALPLFALGWWSSASPSWVTGVLFGFLLALYLVAAGQWLVGRRQP